MDAGDFSKASKLLGAKVVVACERMGCNFILLVSDGTNLATFSNTEMKDITSRLRMAADILDKSDPTERVNLEVEIPGKEPEVDA